MSEVLSIRAKLKEAGLHTIIYGIGSVVQAASALILLPILTGELTKDDFGAYSLIMLATGIAGAIFYFGMTSALPRSYFDYKQVDDRKAVFTTAFVFLIAGALLQSIVGCLLDQFISTSLTGSNRYAEAVSYAMLGGAATFTNGYLLAYLRLIKKSIASVLFSLISLVGTVSITVLLLRLTPGDVVAPFKAVAYVQSVSAILFIAIYGRSAFTTRLMPQELPNLIKFGSASIVASFGSLLVDSLDRLMIQHYIGLGDVGTFSAALRVSMLINVILIMPFVQIWSPMMMEYRTKSNIGDLFTQVFSVFMMLAGFVVILGALFATELLPALIRSGINSASVYIFLTCLVGLMIFGATNFFSAGLFYERKVYLLPFAYYGIGIFKFCGNMILIPLFGLIGATVSAFLSYLLIPFCVHVLSKKYFKFKIEWARLGAFAALMFPSVSYGYYSAFNEEASVVVRIVWLFISMILIYKLCFSSVERHLIKAFFFKFKAI